MFISRKSKRRMKIERMIGIAIAVVIVVLAAAAVLGLFGPFSFDFHIGTGREGMATLPRPCPPWPLPSAVMPDRRCV